MSNEAELDLDQDQDDLDIEPVSQRTGLDRKLRIGFVGVLVAGVVYLMWPSGDTQKPVVEPERTGAEYDGTVNNPMFPTNLRTVSLSAPAQRITLDSPEPVKPQLTQQEIVMLQRALEEKQRRRRAPLVVYDSLVKQESQQTQGGAGNGQFDSARDQIMRDKDQVLSALKKVGQPGGGSGGPARESVAGRIGEGSSSTMVQATLMRERSTTVAQGKLVGAVLETAIQSHVPGMVRAIVSEDMYSEDGQNNVIEKGSRLIGQYETGVVHGQARIFVIWNRIITTNGIDITIDSPGTSPLGLSGHSGGVNQQFFKRFGSSIMLSLIGAAAVSAADTGDVVAEAVAGDFESAAEIALENSINIPPIIYKHQGDQIKVFIARDLNFRNAMLLRANENE